MWWRRNRQEQEGYDKALLRIDEAKRKKETILILSYLHLTKLPPELEALTELQHLHLTSNQLESLPPAIGKLTSLKSLNLQNNQLTTLPPEIENLKALEMLELDNNRFTELPSVIGRLIWLKDLYLPGNELTTLPADLGNLNALRQTSFSSNRLTTLPPAIGKLTSLIELRVDHNELATLPREIGNLTALMWLSLNHNRLTDLPSEICHLTALSYLRLSNNQLRKLPREIGRLLKLEELYLHDNAHLNLPLEVLGPTWRDVRELSVNPTVPSAILSYYFRTNLPAARPLLEARIIVVGDGEVGKTSLIRQLLHDESARAMEETTRDVVIEPWPLTLRDQSITINVWDFGGQEPMHAAHPYFFTERTLYLVLASARESGVEERLSYWLRMVAAHGKGARALAVINKADQHPMDLDRRGLCSEHRALPEDPQAAFFATSCTTGQGIAELRAAVLRELESMDQIWNLTPPEYFEVKTRIVEMRERKEETLSFDKWEEICRDKGVSDNDERERLLNLLRNLGLVVSFPGEPALIPLGVLNPEWVTRAIYPLLTCPELAKSGGLLRMQDLPKLLDSQRYPLNRHTWLVDLMKKFELLFSDETGRLLLPARLPKETPEWALENSWDSADVLRLELRYPVLPEGVISRFIVRMHQDAVQNGRWWRHGIAVKSDGCEARVRALLTDSKIELRVRGPKTQRREFIGHLRGTFRDLSRTLGGGGELWMILGSVVAEKYTDLLLLAEAGERVIKRTAEGRVHEFDLKEHLDLIETEAERKETLRQVIAQNYYEGGRHMGDEIHVGGNAIGSAIGRGNRVVNRDSFKQGVNGEELGKLFETLREQTGKLTDEMKGKDARVLNEKLELLEAEAAKPQPDKSLLKVTGAGLIEAAKTVGEMAGPVIGTVATILKACGVA